MINIRKWIIIFVFIALIFSFPLLIVSKEFFNNNPVLNSVALLVIFPLLVLLVIHHVLFPFLLIGHTVKKGRRILNPDKHLFDALILILEGAEKLLLEKEKTIFYVDDWLLSKRSGGVSRERALHFLQNLKKYGT